jgi:Cofilin/tropomyosin-type actin-binding protein
VTKFNELKLNKKIKFIIYKISDDFKEIVVEETSENGDWDVFREKLLKAQSTSKTVNLPRLQLSG